MKILVINPGSTSTKIGVFDDETLVLDKTLRHSTEEITSFPSIVAQKDFRMNIILDALKENNIELSGFDVIVGRGGLLKPIAGGTYAVTDELEKDLENELSRFSPKEVVANGEVSSFLNLPKFIREKLSAAFEVLGEENFLLEQCRDRVGRQFPDFRLSGPENEELVCALGAMLSYLSETQRSGLERLSAIELYEDSQFMRIDMNTRRNLELTETMRGKEKRGSLLWVLDHTRTAMGKRLLRTCIEQPLLSLSQISRRHNAVDELYSDTILRDRLFEALGGIFDLERIITRVVYGSANARELRSLADTTRRLPAIRACLAGVKT